ncbi:anhydro-N-acetylmuramic acid kinase [Paenibacillus frigoriresistens]|uniref:anhydro-N-acetylmuramic acid kinase n=1 Tax=Paenibacillus alginolyticus TaxID=59839 RepID=UPI001565D7C3|nr:anhydro-N-acetylmuramic acid kinase [Paenibacillus frigoriresistens]NRF94415.1 anhydro-N-acetylmuramic acid kinase [Paenibacillus frigoriresistens]
MYYLAEMANKPERLAVGLMSGSSLDGVDAVLMRVKGNGENTSFDMLEFDCLPFDADTKARILELFEYDTSTIDKVTIMNVVLGELYAKAALWVIAKAGYRPEEVDLIGAWPLAVYHIPGRNRPIDVLGFRIGAVLQLGEINVIAERTGITTIGSFCARDLAAGGNGAPLTGVGDYILFHHSERNRVVQNIGGIGNANLIPAHGGMDNVIGFDTGPGNMVIDAMVRHLTNGQLHYDKDGKMAIDGTVNKEVLEHFLQEPYIQQAPPKASGREDFGEHFARRFLAKAREKQLADNDIVATATAFTVESIALAYERYLMPHASLDEIIVGGGGALNLALMKMLRQRLPQIPVKVDEEYGISSFAKEAMYMVFLANETLAGRPNNVPSITGASRSVVTGLIAPVYRP